MKFIKNAVCFIGYASFFIGISLFAGGIVAMIVGAIRQYLFQIQVNGVYLSFKTMDDWSVQCTWIGCASFCAGIILSMIGIFIIGDVD